MKIEPGIYSDLTNEEYHGSEGVSKSGISKMLRSPRHYWAAYLDPERESREETEAMRVGTAAHKIILEPDDFDNEYHVLPENIDAMNGNKKDKKDYIASIQAKGLNTLKRKDKKMLDGMKKSVMAHHIAAGLFSGGKAEHSFYWIDPDAGVLCKCRPDYWVPREILSDLKSTTDARQDKATRSVGEFEYDVQDVFYSDGVQILDPIDEPLQMDFVFVEKDSPYSVNTFVIDPPDRNAARSAYKRALESYATCKANDSWPSYPVSIKTISLPPYVKR